MIEQQWPPYRVGNADHLHALGVIASVFNLLEFRFRSLFNLYISLPTRMAYRLFAKISAEMRLELMYQALEHSTHPELIKEHVSYFLDGYKSCFENRNVLMHSVASFTWLDPNAERCPVLNPAQPDGIIVFQKWPKEDPFRVNVYRPSLPELRNVADEMNAFEVYGDDLFYHIMHSYEPSIYQTWGFPADVQHPLPDKPALPILLNPTPHGTPTGA